MLILFNLDKLTKYKIFTLYYQLLKGIIQSFKLFEITKWVFYRLISNVYFAMKKIIGLFIVLFIVSSCTITEDVKISSTGEVDYSQKIDLPQMGAFTGKLSDEDKINFNQISNQEFNYLDFLETMSGFGSSKKMVDFEKYTAYEDELSALDFLKFKLDLRDNFGFEIIQRAKSIDEFNSNGVIVDQVFEDIKEKEGKRVAQELAAETDKQRKKRERKGIPGPKPMFSDNPLGSFSSTLYVFDGNKFSKTVDAEKFLKAMKFDSEDNEGDSGKFIKDMLQQFKFKTRYTFSRKIKSINIEDAMFSSDGKTVIKEYNLAEFYNNPKVGEFIVVLEE